MEIEKDSLFTLAERYVEGTAISVFLTGKAGTGKTTFLKEIVSHTSKRCAVVAPTGVAAINAGGVTIHSFFQLPLCPYLPDVKELVTEYQLPESQRALRKERIRLLRTLDLLIIDEISMVRADIMDAMDAVLRRYRHSDKPFGGVQLLMIGDIQQLPPVVRDEERHFMEMVYPSPFFFNAKAIIRLPYVVIELEKIHRQSDRAFTDILNDIRTGHPSADTLTILNSRLDHSFVPPEKERWIRLTTHNWQADTVNSAKMKELDGDEVVFDAEVEGTFPESAYPADTTIKLKVGAQVMFIRNDSSGKGKYYNGKIGTVKALKPIPIVEDMEGNLIEVLTDKWENIKYELNKESGEIVSRIEGTFLQVPLRLAWAITIHKSQGLTFDKVIIDAGSAFSFGQVYVALSRCRSLEGIVLTSRITERCTFSSNEVSTYESTYTPKEQAAGQINACEQAYYVSSLCDAFNLDRLKYLYNRANRIWQVDLSNLYPTQAEKFKAIGDGEQGLKFLQETAGKFCQQITHIAASEQGIKAEDSPKLKERISKACGYFTKMLRSVATTAAPLFMVEIDDKEKKKALKDIAEELLTELKFRIDIYTEFGDNGFTIKSFNKAKVAVELAEKKSFKSLVSSFSTKTKSNGKSANSYMPDDEEPDGAETYTGNENPQLVKALSEWRKEKCKEQGVPAYLIMHQKVLLAIADVAPQSREEFLLIKGFGKSAWSKYGDELLGIVREYLSR